MKQEKKKNIQDIYNAFWAVSIMWSMLFELVP